MADADRLAAVSRLRQTLLDRASSQGGWAYYAGKAARIEPTCWALVALAEAPQGRNITRVAVAKTEVASDDDGTRAQLLNQHSLDELFGGAASTPEATPAS